MDKYQITQGVADQLWATEAAIDAALAQAAQLMGTMVEARRDLNLAAGTTDLAFARVTAAMATLTDARSKVVESHDAMAEIRLRMGLRTKLIGFPDKPDEKKENGTGHLRAV